MAKVKAVCFCLFCGLILVVACSDKVTPTPTTPASTTIPPAATATAVAVATPTITLPPSPMATNRPQDDDMIAQQGSLAPPATVAIIPSSTPTLTPTPVPLIASPAGVIFRTEDGLWLVAADGQYTKLSDDPFARLSPDGRYVAYTWLDDIHVFDRELGIGRNLTNSPGVKAWRPKWLPGHDNVIFFHFQPEEYRQSTMHGEYLLAAVDTQGQEVFRFDGALYALGIEAVAPDGRQIIFWGLDEEEYVLLSIFDLGSGPAAYELPYDYLAENEYLISLSSMSWSPDGRYQAWVAGSRVDGEFVQVLKLIDLETASSHRLHAFSPYGSDGFAAPPAWSPDGQWLAYYTLDVEPPGIGIWLISVDGQQKQFLAVPGNADWAVWHRDSKELIVVDDDTGNYWFGIDGQAIGQLDLPAGAVVVEWR